MVKKKFFALTLMVLFAKQQKVTMPLLNHTTKV